MNKIYKVVFDKRTESFVVVSELAATHGKASSSTDERKTPTKHSLSKLAASLVLGSSLLATQSALADYTAGGGRADDEKHHQAIAIGQGATADGYEGSIAIGGEKPGLGSAEALGQGAVAIGSAAKAKEKQTVAVGQGAQATGNQSIAIGADILSSGVASIIIGGDDADTTPYERWAWSEADGKVKENAGQYQIATAKGDLAIGIGSKVQALGDGSLAMGVVATSFGLESISMGAKSSTKGTNSIAIGTESASVGDNSVAMGAQSLAQEVSTVAIGDSAQSQSANSTVIGKGATIGKDKAGGVVIGFESVDHGYKGKNETLSVTNTVDFGRYTYSGFAGTINDQGDFVSVGKPGDERKIINVAPADITEKSTEAVNGSQLYVTLKDLSAVKEVLGVKEDGTVDPKSYIFKVANNQQATDKLSNTADTWDLKNSNELTLAATSDLTVSTDENGKVIYGISDTYKKDVNDKITAAQNAADAADAAAKAADAKAVAAQTDATKALNDAAAAQTAADDAQKDATQALADAKGAKGAADAADEKAQKAQTAADAADAKAQKAQDGVDAINQKLANVADGSVVGNGKDGKDGKDGTGADSAGAQGLTGQDGLNGKDLTSKVNALRNGEAGPVVYTDEEGKRLAKGNDGKYYPADQVQANGEPNADATPVDNPIASVVNPDGTAATPTTMGNIKSTVGLDSPADAPIAADKAKEGVEGLLSKTTGLNNAATVGDLQALAQAGIDFTGDNSTATVHRPLGSKLTVEGEGDWNGTNSATNNLYVEANETDNKLVVKLNKELTGLSKVETTDEKGNTATLTPTGTEVKDAAGNTASYGAQGATVTDGATGSTASYNANGVTVKDKDGNPTITVANVDGTPTLSFGTDENGNGTGKITGVASGEVGEGSSDVVTGGQLHTLREEILTNVKGELDGKMANLANEVDRNNRELRGGIATVTAMSSIPQVTLPGKSAVGVGAGTFEGESAISVGYSRMSDNGKVIVKVSAGASTQNTFNLGAGLAYQW